MKKIECIIMDWAGTAVDYGCFAPVAAFIESFNAIGTPVTAAETRAHMGLTKVEEIRALFNIDRVRNVCRGRYIGALCRLSACVVCLSGRLYNTYSRCG